MENLTFTNTSKILSIVNSKVMIFNLTANGSEKGNLFSFELSKVDFNGLYVNFSRFNTNS